MIVQNIGADGTTDMTFTVGKADLPRAQDMLEKARGEIGFEALLADPEVAKISVVGVGMRSHAGVATTMFKALAEKGINIQVISTSEIKVSVLIAADYTELAVRALHTAYGLDAAGGMTDAPPSARPAGPVPSSTALMARGAAFLGSALRHPGRRDVLGERAPPGRRAVQCRRLRRDRLRRDGAAAPGRGDRRHPGADAEALRREPDHHASAARPAGRRSAWRRKVGHIVFAGGIPPGSAIKAAKDGGAKVVCFAPALALAKKLVRSGADALVIEGSRGRRAYRPRVA